MESTTTSAAEGIAATNRQFMQAFENRDAAGVACFYTDDGQVLPPGAPIITGKDGIAGFWTVAMDMGIERVELRSLELTEMGDLAIEIGRAILFGGGDVQIDDPKFMVVWKRTAAGWRLHRDIWNSDVAPGGE